MPREDRPILQVRGASKSFGGVPALADVDLTVRRGAVHGVLGKNGAGKSTLMNVIAGSLRPDQGSVLLDGADITHLPLSDRKDRGVHLMEQHAEVFETLTVAENLALPSYLGKGPVIDWRGVRRRAVALLEDYGLSLDPDTLAGSLNLPEQRQLCLIKTLSDNGSVAILDEPTTAMSRRERQALFSWIRDLTALGLTFIYITHFNQDLIEMCDEYTVLRDGVVVGSGGSLANVSPQDLSRMVTGAEVKEFRRDRRAFTDRLLAVEHLCADGATDISLHVAAGEIVGLVGLPGSGTQTVARALAGLAEIESGSVSVRDRKMTVRHPADAIAAGIAYLPHDRMHEGVFSEFSVAENLRAGNWPTHAGVPGVINRPEIGAAFHTAKASFGIHTSSATEPIKRLSGGNQQKVLLGRLLGTEPSVLILDEPTAGIDVGAKEDVHRIIDELTRSGVGVIMLAYDPSELTRLVDRALVFRDGEIVSELTAEQLTTEHLLSDLSHGHTRKAKA